MEGGSAMRSSESHGSNSIPGVVELGYLMLESRPRLSGINLVQ